MADFDFKTYMADCAIKMKAIGHTENKPRFFIVSSIAALEGLLGRLTTGASFPGIIIYDTQEGFFGDGSTSQNWLDNPDYTFYVVDKLAKLNDTDSAELLKRSCKDIGFKIIARMLKHKKEALRSGNDPYGLELFKKQNFPYQTIGPIGNNCYGVMFNITVPRVADMVYTNDDWSE